MSLEQTFDILFYVMIVTSFWTFLIAIPFYIFILIVIIRNRHKTPFNSQFFVFFVALGIADIGCYLGHFAKKAAFIGVLPGFFIGQRNIFATLQVFFLSSLSLAQYQFIMLITVNRFVVICCPQFCSDLWSFRFSLFLIAIVAIDSFGVCVPVLVGGAEFQTRVYAGTYGNITKLSGAFMLNQEFNKFYTLLFRIEVFVLLGLCLFCYSAMIWKIGSISRSGVQTLAKYEIRLAFVGFVLFLLCALLIAYIIVNYYLGAELSIYATNILNATADFTDMHNQWALFFASAELRRTMKTTILNLVTGKNSKPEVAQSPLQTPAFLTQPIDSRLMPIIY